jgi:DNA ligase-1
MGYYITEKLDGNRCIASYEDSNWVFRSRNGKLMHVNFDMGDLPKEFVYDGEVMSRSQTISSMKLTLNLVDGLSSYSYYNDEFSTTSGLINRHGGIKDLVYNIFDIMLDNVPYYERRDELSRIQDCCSDTADVRIVPVIAQTDFVSLENITSDYLGKICNMGGEGLMINLGSGMYNHKRTDQLLKLKQVQSIDMTVTGIQEGSGKYEYMVGAINCLCNTDDGKCIEVSVGSGLSDEQRMDWYLHPEKIIGKIVEIQYFSTSQDGKNRGSNNYSLRFPRLKVVRTDKSTTSQY